MKQTILHIHTQNGTTLEEIVEWKHLPLKGDIICYEKTDYQVFKIHHDLDLELTTIHLKKHFT